MALSEGARSLLQLIDHALVERREAAVLRRGEVVGEREGSEVFQRSPHGVEARLDLGRARRSRRRGRVFAERVERSAEELLLVGLVGGAVGVDEHHRVARLHRVAFEGEDERVLVLRRKRGERVREGGSEQSAPQSIGGGGREASAERDASCDPAGLLAQEASDRLLRATILVDQRADDPRLVERGERSRRRVRLEDEPLVVLTASGSLHDDRDGGMALLAPEQEPLESIDNFVAAALGGNDSDGEVGAVAHPDDRRAGPQGGVTCTQRGRGQDEARARHPASLRVGSRRRLRPRCLRSSTHELPRSPCARATGSSPFSDLSYVKRCPRAWALQNGTSPSGRLPSLWCPTMRSRGLPFHSSWSTLTSSATPKRSAGAISSPAFGSNPQAR